MISGNSAPTFTFVKDPLYISLNNDNPIMITAGTYSTDIVVNASDGNILLTNINIALASAGFTF